MYAVRKSALFSEPGSNNVRWSPSAEPALDQASPKRRLGAAGVHPELPIGADRTGLETDGDGVTCAVLPHRQHLVTLERGPGGRADVAGHGEGFAGR